MWSADGRYRNGDQFMRETKTKISFKTLCSSDAIRTLCQHFIPFLLCHKIYNIVHRRFLFPGHAGELRRQALRHQPCSRAVCASPALGPNSLEAPHQRTPPGLQAVRRGAQLPGERRAAKPKSTRVGAAAQRRCRAAGAGAAFMRAKGDGREDNRHAPGD